MIEKEIKAQDFIVKEVLSPENIERVCDKFNFTSEEDMCAAVGFNGITAEQVVNRLSEKLRKEREEQNTIDKIVSDMKTTAHKKQSLNPVSSLKGLITY